MRESLDVCPCLGDHIYGDEEYLKFMLSLIVWLVAKYNFVLYFLICEI